MAEEIETIIAEAEKQVQRKVGTKEFVYVETELTPCIDYIFDNPNLVTDDNSQRVKELFRSIAGMEKSTAFGYSFYDRLEQSRFLFVKELFVQEVLREAVETEPYYNCNDAALRAYLIVALRNANVSEGISNGLLKHITKGHRFDYIRELRAVGESRPREQVNIPQELKNTLLFAASHDKFENTRAKALCALVYFSIGEIVPALEDRLRRYSEEITKIEYKLLGKITTTATALEYLTGNNKYREFVEFIIPEMGISRTAPYPSDFINTLTARLKEF